jgi:DNA-binding transcriptional MerR regulator
MADDELTTQEVLNLCQVSYRKLDIWTTSGYLGNDQKQVGNGVRRRYTKDEVTVLRRMIDLNDAGVLPGVASQIARGNVDSYNKLAQALDNCHE